MRLRIARAYVRRPDLGRVLAEESAAFLKPSPCDVVFVIADGLSAIAPERNAIPLLDAVLPMLFQSGWASGPVCVVKNARVAIGDQIGSLLGASLSVVLIGRGPASLRTTAWGPTSHGNRRQDAPTPNGTAFRTSETGGLNPAAAARALILVSE